MTLKVTTHVPAERSVDSTCLRCCLSEFLINRYFLLRILVHFNSINGFIVYSSIYFLFCRFSVNMLPFLLLCFVASVAQGQEEKPPYIEAEALRLFYAVSATYAPTSAKTKACFNRAGSDFSSNMRVFNFQCYWNVSLPGEPVGVDAAIAIVAYSSLRHEVLISYKGTICPKNANGTSDCPGVFHEFLDARLSKTYSYFKKQSMGSTLTYFRSCYESAMEEMGKYIQDLIHEKNDPRVSITGISLGASLASITAAGLVLDEIVDGKRITMYSFGQPRTGGPDYASKYDCTVPNSYRIVNHYDLIPLVPWIPNSTTYYHHGTEIWYGDYMDSALTRDYSICAKKSDCSLGINFVAKYLTEEVNLLDHLTYFAYPQTVDEFAKDSCSLPI
ncbi:hypothetical protein L596_027437 [Steinernema carpocapsae]|uniref:Fungal lipase-type domain-containing protein n=1 Tax=Steinernema carpocapsae TaxID=34508 RepID=A0A4U5M4A2_STECR|nr:hypothetical protein L596_027437 [Steinernema carpocapsae]